MKKKIIISLFFGLLMACANAFAATLMPPGKQQFFDQNGAPLAGGSVYFYIPNTTTPKNTWQDSNSTTLNTNPVVLDAGGFAIIYGSGSYRQIVKDSAGNTIYDQLTASTSEVTVDNIQYYASSISGSPNSITVSLITPSDFSLTSGKTLRIIAPFSNTGSTTINPISLGSTTIKRVTTTGGTCNLAGGELVSGGVYDLFYDGTNFVLLNPSVTDNPGDIKPFAGSTVPNGYVLPYGQAISRTTYACYFGVASTTFGSGDGSTTFNVPDLRGRVVAGVDNMGGSAASRITAGVSGITGTTLGAAGGDQNPNNHSHGVGTLTQTTYSLVSANFGTNGAVGGSNFNAFSSIGSLPSSTGTLPSGSTATSGTGTAGNVQPSMMLNMILRL